MLKIDELYFTNFPPHPRPLSKRRGVPTFADSRFVKTVFMNLKSFSSEE